MKKKKEIKIKKLEELNKEELIDVVNQLYNGMRYWENAYYLTLTSNIIYSVKN